MRRNGTVVCAGFVAEGNQWRRPGITVERGPRGGFLLEKDLFVTEPLFYATLRKGLGVATNYLQLVELLARDGIEPLPDLDFVHDYLAFQCPLTNATFCHQIRLLRNGETVSIDPSGRAASRLNQLPPPTEKQPPELPDLRARLSEPLEDTANAVFHISSGLDSTLLVLLARASRPADRIRVATCRTRGRGATQELEIAGRLVSELGLEVEVHDFTSLDLWDCGRKLIRRVLGYPIAHPSHLVRYLLDTAIARQSEVIVTGRGADECLAGYPWHRAEFADAKEHIERLRCTPDAVLRDLLRSETGDRIDGRAAGEHHDHLGTGELTLTSRLRYDLLTVFEAWNIIDHSLTRALDVRYVSPFLDPDLMAALVELPDRLKIDDQVQKIFLRESFADLYPRYVLDNPKIGLTIDLRDYLLDESVDEIMKKLVDDSPFGSKYLDRSTCEEMVRSTLDGRRNYGWQIWSLYLCSEAYDTMRRSSKAAAN